MSLSYTCSQFNSDGSVKTEPSELDWLQVYDDTLMKICFNDWNQSSATAMQQIIYDRFLFCFLLFILFQQKLCFFPHTIGFLFFYLIPTKLSILNLQGTARYITLIMPITVYHLSSSLVCNQNCLGQSRELCGIRPRTEDLL